MPLSESFTIFLFADLRKPKTIHLSEIHGLDNNSCLLGTEDAKCRTLKYILENAVTHRADFDTIFIEDRYSSPELERIILSEERNRSPTQHRLVTIYCRIACNAQLQLHFWAQQFETNITIIFRNIHFADSRFAVQNVLLYFQNCSLSATLFEDIPPRAGSFGHISLEFSKTMLCAESQIVFNSTFSVFVKANESTSHNTHIEVQSAFLWFVCSNNILQGSTIVLRATHFAFGLVETSHFSDLNKPDSVLQIKAGKLALHMSSTTIANNSGGIELNKYDVGLLHSWIQVNIVSCVFHHNVKLGAGGAFHLAFFTPGNSVKNFNHVWVSNSKFSSNSVHRKDFSSAHGGAMNFVAELSDRSSKEFFLDIEMVNNTFIDNEAEDAGGAIFISKQSIITRIVGCVFEFHDRGLETKTAKFIQANSDVRIQSSILRYNSRKSRPLLDFEMLSETSKIDSIDVFVECLPWHRLEFTILKQTSSLTGAPILQKALIFCSSCLNSYYVPSFGKFQLNLSANESVLLDVDRPSGSVLECTRCPPGAHCPGDSLNSKPNFWGHLTDDSFKFDPCPLRYCCVPTNSKVCIGYDTCSGNRNGTLCGECERGFSLSLLSDKCIPNEKCNFWWVWLLAVTGAVLYMLWYTFKNDILNLFYLFLSFISRKHSMLTSDTGSDDDKGYFGIMTYFVQAAAVMRLTVYQSDSYLSTVESYIGMLLSIELSYVTTDVCATADIGTVEKTALKLMFLFGIFLSWHALNLCVILHERLSTCAKQRQVYQLKNRLTNGLVEIYKYTYSGITGIAFYSVTCVTMGNNLVWYYDGSVKCFSKWQTVMLVFGLCHVVNYPLFLHIAMKLLRNKNISTLWFWTGSCAPFPFLIHGLYLLSKSRKSTKIGKVHALKSDGGLNDKEMDLYKMLKSGYKESKSGAQYWESVMIFRRLLLSATTLIPNALIRLCSCCVLCTLFLGHHLRIYPFASDMSNRAETISLLLLCWVAVINAIKAVYIFMGVLPYGSDVNVIKFLSSQEPLFSMLLMLFIVLFEMVSKIKMNKIV